MYKLEFKGGTPQKTGSWSLAVEKKEINGPVILVVGHKCVSDLKLVEFSGEPDSVDQVLVATWIDSKLSLKNAKGQFIEHSPNGWVTSSRAISDSGLFEVDEGWTFTSTTTLEIEGVHKFGVLVKLQEPELTPLTEDYLQTQVGRPLKDDEVVELFKAADKGHLHESLAKLRESKR